MKRTILALALAAIAASSPLLAQQLDFRSAGSGIWTDSHIWEKNEAGVWLKPIEGIYPGERHNRNVDVTVEDGSTVVIGKDQVVHISSLAVLGGRVIVEGMLIIGPTSDDPNEDNIADDPSEDIADPAILPPVIGDNGGPQLLQNVPNPLGPQFGYETTIRFYVDKQYTHARLAIYDQLAHMVQNVFDEANPAIGWHTVKVRLDRIQTGSYPLVLELPSSILRRMIMVIR